MFAFAKHFIPVQDSPQSVD